MIRVIRNKILEEVVFFLVLFLALLTSLLVRPSLEAIDWKVLFSLFNLMLMSLAFEKYHLLDAIALFILKRVKSERALGWILICITAVLGMIMTNDVALLTIVPITILIAKKAGINPAKIIVLETLSANIGSSLTPFGNPQNLYLYSFYHIATFEFLGITFVFVLLGMLLLFITNLSNSAKEISYQVKNIQVQHKKRIGFYLLLFLLVLLSVLRVIDYRVVSIIVMVCISLLDRRLILKVDYYLLGTFIGFFILIDNVVRFEGISKLMEIVLNSRLSVFLVAVFVSQGISNVPSAILLSGFTTDYKALLLGVSVGGIGTLIASMANLIAYKIYIRAYSKKMYLPYYYRVSGVLLFLIIVSSLIFLWR